MATVVLRLVKGAALTYEELDNNFSNLNAAKLEVVDLSLGTVTSSNIAILNSGGASVTVPAATAANAGLLTSGDKVKLDLLNGKTVYVDTTAPPSPNVGDLWLDIS